MAEGRLFILSDLQNIVYDFSMTLGITGTLDPDDLHVVLSKIIDAKTKAEYLGLALGLSPATVESICQQYGDRQDRLLHILKEYLKKVDPDPTWKVIAEALRSPTVDFPYLAKRIINEKIPTQQLSDQGKHYDLVCSESVASCVRVGVYVTWLG